MNTLTDQQATLLANDFLSLELIVGNYRAKNLSSLSKSQRTRLSDLQWTLLNYSDDLFALSTVIIMDDVERELDRIKQITEHIDTVVSSLAKVQKVIDIAASAIILAATIFSKNPVAIVKSIDDLIDTVNA